MMMWLIDRTNFKLLGKFTDENKMRTKQEELKEQKILTGVVRGEDKDVNRVLPTTKHQVILYKNILGDPSARAPKANLFRHIYSLLNEDYVMPKKKTATQMKAKKKGSKKTKPAAKKVARDSITFSLRKKDHGKTRGKVAEIYGVLAKAKKAMTASEIATACKSGKVTSKYVTDTMWHGYNADLIKQSNC